MAVQMPLFVVNWVTMLLLYWKIWREARMHRRRMNLSTVSCPTEKNNRKSVQVEMLVRNEEGLEEGLIESISDSHE